MFGGFRLQATGFQIVIVFNAQKTLCLLAKGFLCVVGASSKSSPKEETFSPKPVAKSYLNLIALITFTRVTNIEGIISANTQITKVARLISKIRSQSMATGATDR